MLYLFTRGLLAGLLLLTLPGTAVKAQPIPRAEAGNTLQVVTSLLNSRSAKRSDDSALSAIEDQHRGQAIPSIHRKLYQREGVARIPLADCIEEVVACLRDSSNLFQPIAFHLPVGDIELDVTQAVPPGRITNGAIGAANPPAPVRPAPPPAAGSKRSNP